MPERWLLVHPPLLGPAVLRPLAAALEAAGHAVEVPDLRGQVQDPTTSAPSARGWDDRWTAAAAGSNPADVVVAYSGAGALLPRLATSARRAVWLDAVLPREHGPTWPDDLRQLVAEHTRGDGRVDAWTTWWGPDAMSELLPDEALRAAVAAEAQPLPADLWSYGLTVPPTTADPLYVHLSPAYAPDAEEARRRGWPVVGDGSGAHLDVATDPAGVAALLG